MSEAATAPVAPPPAPTGPPPARSARDVYLVHPVVDILVAGGGLSLICFFLFRAFHSGERTSTVIRLAQIFSLVINYPHFAATSFRLYQSFDRMMQFPKTAFLTPVLVGAGLVAALLEPAFAPWYCKIFLVWSGYHYSGQTKGIALLYARRLGVEIDPISRWLIVVACYGSWLYLIVGAETRPDWGPFFAVTIPSGLPGVPWHLSDTVFGPVSKLIFVVTVAALVPLYARIFLTQGRVFPIAAVAPIVAQTIWYGPAMGWGGTRIQGFAEFIPLFHSFQYLLVAWVFQVKEQSARPGYFPSIDTVVWESAKWLLGIVVGGFILFVAIPWFLELRLYPEGYGEPCFIAAVQIHHFFVDGVIWKIRDPRTRSMLAGNLLDLAGLARPA